MSLYSKILKQIPCLENEIQKSEKRLRSTPPGRLCCRKHGKGYQYYQHFPDGKERYIPVKEQALIKALARKAFEIKHLKELQREYEAANAYRKKYESKKWNTRLLLKSPAYQALLSDHDLNQKIQEWASAPYEKSNIHPEHLIIKTSDNSYVRSKSEALIYEGLLNHHLKNRYECKLNLGNISIYPDFTILHPENGRQFIWEHFGKCDNKEYVYNNIIKKLPGYLLNGFIPGDNLIITWETSNRPMSPADVEEIIGKYFC